MTIPHPNPLPAGEGAGATTEIDAGATLQKVLAMLVGTSVEEIEVEWDGGMIRVRRDASTPLHPPPTPDAHATLADGRVVVRSAHVGTFHLDGTGWAEGTRVEAGATLGHVDTLSIHNYVRVQTAGTLEALLVPDGAAVEYGQALAVISSGDGATGRA